MDRNGEMPVFWRWLVHPVTLVAAMVLVLNDFVFKAAYPGLITGKLSDAAGLVVAPPLLATVVGVVLRAGPPRRDRVRGDDGCGVRVGQGDRGRCRFRVRGVGRGQRPVAGPRRSDRPRPDALNTIAVAALSTPD